MTRTDFSDLNADCRTAMRNYIREADITMTLLAEGSAEPMTFTDRLKILSQEQIENEALAKYHALKGFLHEAVLRGYGHSSRATITAREVCFEELTRPRPCDRAS